MLTTKDHFSDYARIASISSILTKVVIIFIVVVLLYYFLDTLHVLTVPLQTNLLVGEVLLVILFLFIIPATGIGLGGGKISDWYKYFSKNLQIDNLAVKMNYRSIILGFEDLFIFANTSNKIYFIYLQEKHPVTKNFGSFSQAAKIKKHFCESVNFSSIPKLKVKYCRGDALVFSPAELTWFKGPAEFLIVEPGPALFSRDKQILKELLELVFNTFALGKANLNRLIK